MDKKAVLQENLDREIRSFRRSFERMKPADVYKCFYKIHFFEEYYELLISDFIESYKHLEEWLSVHSYPLAFLYDEWLCCDGAFSGDWNDMVNFMINVMDYEEECTKEEN